jgi:hypothetical protein
MLHRPVTRVAMATKQEREGKSNEKYIIWDYSLDGRWPDGWHGGCG